MRILLASLAIAVVTGCGPSNRHGGTGGDDVEADACAGLECRIDNCAARNMPDTTISGTVFAPNGTLALYGVNVYVPASDPGPLTDGVQCSQCEAAAPGGSIGLVAQSDAMGKFTLSKVPSGVNVPIVIQVGKWRRRFDIPMVMPCTDNPLPAALTSLPKNKTEGDIPRIALTTGCDHLECLLKKLGIDAKEFTGEGSTGRVNLFASGGVSQVADGSTLGTGESLWSDINKLKKYDIAIFACECSPHSPVTTQEMQNVKQFADLGGRIFMTHYNAQWISGSSSAPQQVWPGVAACSTEGSASGPGTIDTVHNPKGQVFSDWMTNVGASSSPGVFPITYNTDSCRSVDNEKAERWVYIAGSPEIPQNFQFTTPQEMPKDNRCGKVVFSDMHVSDEAGGSSFPSECSTNGLSPQEKALAFMFFDISTCVGQIN